ncbi:Phospholipase/carboxylesterase/thioesterase [Leucosporidium creatinivorum]|uniref:Acyl-protein thioesterase 1 n=1 Tax=Leucosporidium creatinivorum TaxID=106004 RepID=A0A1Y2CJI5_9BASI|nr:Phospholipase/carboxylesterase/thioesterase [Leucosporidium creatinivorum]
MDPLIVKAPSEHTATIIFSHGLGDTAQGWLSAEQFSPHFPNLKWVLTNAPRREVTFAPGQKMTSWFDVRGLGGQPRDEDTEGMLASVEVIKQLVAAEERAGIPSERVVVGGFSQGGVISLLTGLTLEKQLAGILCLSGYLGLTHDNKINGLQQPISKTTPFFWGHGEADQMIKFDKAQRGHQRLLELGLSKLEWHAYPRMPHTLGQQETLDVVRWLQTVLA